MSRTPEEEKSRKRADYLAHKEERLAKAKERREFLRDSPEEKARKHAYYAEHKEEWAASQKARRDADPDAWYAKQNEYRKTYKEKHRDELREYKKDWAREHPPSEEKRIEILEYAKKRRKEYPELISKRGKKWHAKNKERRNAEALARNKENPSRTHDNQLRYRVKHPEKIKEKLASWRSANPDKVRKYSNNYRAHKELAFIEIIDPLVVFTRDKGRCQLCLKRLKRNDDWVVDHIVPLRPLKKYGDYRGTHCYANVQLAHPKCNGEKSNKLPMGPYRIEQLVLTHPALENTSAEERKLHESRRRKRNKKSKQESEHGLFSALDAV